jgi:ribonuclease BN (tRNA processing enzyme)
MTLSLTVIGGAAAWPNPGQGCSSYLVRSAATSIVVDCGPDTVQELRKHVDYRSVSAIVISHCHSDHMLDLVPYRYGLQYGPNRPSDRITVWLPQGGIQRLEALASAISNQDESASDFWRGVFDLREYDADAGIGVGDVRIEFARTQHFVPCFAMRISDAEGRSIAYSADTGAIEPLMALFEGANLAVIESTLVSYSDTPVLKRGHLTPEDAGALAQAAGVSTLVVTHLWSERQNEDVIAAAATTFDGTILPARPGLMIHV